MALGPGKYDPECTQALLSTGANAVVLIVLGGDRGSGFCVSAAGADLSDTVIAQLPALLRNVADQIEQDVTG